MTIVLIIAATFAALVLAGMVYQWRGHSRDARLYPPPGRLIDSGKGTRLHANVTGSSHGSGAPPVILEAGIAATSLSWRLIEPEVAKFAQAISYDRAGLGWSEAVRGACDAGRLMEELRSLLDRLEVAKPRVLVAHSFGGLIATAYAARYPDELAGIVLVDPVGAEEWANPSAANVRMLRRAIFLSRFGEALARLGVVRFALNRLAGGARATPQFIARATSGRSGKAFMDRMVGQIRKLPPEAWPIIQSHWTDPKCFRSMRGHLASLPESATAALTEATIATPLIVLSAGNASAAQREAQERLVARSPDGRLEVVGDAGHWIMLDRPEVVIAAIQEIAATSATLVKSSASINPSNPLADPSTGAGR